LNVKGNSSTCRFAKIKEGWGVRIGEKFKNDRVVRKGRELDPMSCVGKGLEGERFHLGGVKKGKGSVPPIELRVKETLSGANTFLWGYPPLKPRIVTLNFLRKGSQNDRADHNPLKEKRNLKV